LLHKPSLLLLDEPTVGLDLPSRQAIVDHVHRLVAEANIAVLWATHLIDEIYQDDGLIVLDKGKVKAKGSIEAVLSGSHTTSIKDAFFSLTQ
jgi:ABC-2 type transport system ATP-binding protein